MQTKRAKYTSTTTAIINLMPEGEIAMVIYRGQRTSDECWWWGNRMLLWLDEVMKSGLVCTQDEVYIAMSQVSGIPKSTLRYYKAHAEYFPEEIREDYAELPFSHFAVAKSFGPDKDRAVLDESLKQFINTGRWCSAEYLKWRFSRLAEPTLEANREMELSAMAIEDQYEQAENEVPLTYPESEDEKEEATASDYQAREWFYRLDCVINNMEEAVKLLPVSTDAKSNMSTAIGKLRTAFEEAIKEIAH